VIIYTIGHSTRSLEEFLALLQREVVECLVDVRAFPGSRRHPQFNDGALAHALEDHGMAYHHAPALGGRRRPDPHGPPSAWRNESFRAYADYMRTAAFHGAIDDLLAMSSAGHTVIMCSEVVPWRCHRSLIGDALTARGVHVEHILDSKTSPHVLTSFAVVRDGEVTYPPSREAADDGAQHALALDDV
jgi:uncharacterized protein (DUF488 family)